MVAERRERSIADAFASLRASVDFGVLIAVVYSLAVLTSVDYPRNIWGLDIPFELADSYRWFLVMGVGPPILAGVWLFRRSPWPSRRAVAVSAIVAAHVLLEAISALGSGAAFRSLVLYTARDAALWFLLMGLVHRNSSGALRWVAATLVAVALLQTFAGLAQQTNALSAGLTSLAERWTSGAAAEFRARGLTAYPTVLGALLATTLSLLPLVFQRRRLWLPLLAIGVVAIIASGARSGGIGVVAGLMAALVVAAGEPAAPVRRSLAVVLLVIAAGVAVAGVHPDVLMRVGGAGGAERVQGQEIALSLWREHPWFGVGSGDFSWAARQMPEYAELEWRIVPVHNWLLLRLAEGGIAGGAVAIILWAGPALWLLLRGAGRKDAMLAASFTALAVSQWFDYEMLYWIGGPVAQSLLLALWVGPWDRPLAERSPA